MRDHCYTLYVCVYKDRFPSSIGGQIDNDVRETCETTTSAQLKKTKIVPEQQLAQKKSYRQCIQNNKLFVNMHTLQKIALNIFTSSKEVSQSIYSTYIYIYILIINYKMGIYPIYFLNLEGEGDNLLRNLYSLEYTPMMRFA